MQSETSAIASSSSRMLPRAFVGAPAAYAEICSWALAQGLGDRPLDVVVTQWLKYGRSASAATSATGALRAYPRSS